LIVYSSLSALLLTQDGLDSGNVFLNLCDADGVLQLIGGVLKTEVEQVLLQLHQLGLQLGCAHLTDFVSFHLHSPPFSVSFLTILHLTGSLWLARRRASRATSSETPAISNMTRPGLTTATQYSGAPLPEPIRVPRAFLVTGLSGKILIQTLPPRLV